MVLPRNAVRRRDIGLDHRFACDDTRVMGPIQRAIRRLLNPISTRVTMIVQGAGMRRAFRRLPRGSASYGPVSASAKPRPGLRPPHGVVEQRTRGEVAVPDVVGLTLDEAWSVLHAIGLVPVGPDPDAAPLAATGWRDQGVVVEQRPDPGTVLPIGAAVTLWIERGRGSAGMREPRRPRPHPQAASGMIDEQTGDAIG